MSRSGDVDDPTTEYPRYAAGRAEPGDPAPQEPGRDEPLPPADAPAGPAARFGPVRWLIGAGVVVAVLATLLVGARMVDLPGFSNPFADRQTDRSQPVLLQSMRDLSRFVAAEGNFQVVIDLQDNRDNIPEFLLNQRTLFVAAGRVEAYVDFANLADDAVRVSEDGRIVELHLPAPQLGKAALDLESSYVFAEERGLLNRIGEVFGGDPNRQQRVYVLAEQRITAAAQGTGLAERAQDNTRKMLEGLLRSLGYPTVTVMFAAP